MELLTRESVDRDRDGHWFAQTPRARSSSLSAEGAVLLLAGSGKGRLAPAPARMERTRAGTFPFPGLRTFLAGSSHCYASVRFRFRCSFADRVAAPTDRTAGEVLEPAHF
jgi:hypothetical protein